VLLYWKEIIADPQLSAVMEKRTGIGSSKQWLIKEIYNLFWNYK
jgi:hypothetical protein